MYNALVKELDSYSYEIIFVDDGSSDNTWGKIAQFSCHNKKVKGVKLTRCFGHQSALKAGMDASIGDCVITIDGDLQQPIYVIKALFKKWQEGFKIVNAIRNSNSQQGFFENKLSQTFYWIHNHMNNEYQLSKSISD